MNLNGKQRRHLRALAHHLDPVVLLGHKGLTEGVVRQVDTALDDHELIKVRLGTECPMDVDAVGAELGEQTKSSVVGTVGRVLMLYRRHPKEPKIELPKPGAA